MKIDKVQQPYKIIDRKYFHGCDVMYCYYPNTYKLKFVVIDIATFMQIGEIIYGYNEYGEIVLEEWRGAELDLLKYQQVDNFIDVFLNHVDETQEHLKELLVQCKG